ncbi:MAG TPA: DUF2975 domain-containing protein [Rhizomicrobium sp.]|nr:DUF2975 domain-containing protein [Rhizomicrobium sp.]
MSDEPIALHPVRAVILALMLLVPAAAIYAFFTGGIAGMDGGDVVFGMRTGGAPPQAMPLMAAPPPGAVFDDRLTRTACKEAGGVRTCTTTEQVPHPGEEGGVQTEFGPVTAPFPPPQGGVAGHAFGFGVSGPPPQAIRAQRPALADRAFFVGGVFPRWSVERLAVATTLTTLWLVLFLAILYVFERLLRDLQASSIFSERTMHRLQTVGFCVIAMAFLPQFDVVSLVVDAGTAVIAWRDAAPIPVALPSQINVALLLAGAFTVLGARIVRDAARLAADVEGTV